MASGSEEDSGQTGDEIHGDVGPGAMRKRQWMQETSMGLERGLVLVARRCEKAALLFTNISATRDI